MSDLRPDDSLGYRVNLLARLFEHELRRRIAAHGVVPGQFPALLTLFQEDGLTQAELCRRVSIEQPTMANTLKRMERDGLVRRAPDPHDARRARIHLTPRALALEGPLTEAAREINALAVEDLDADERAAFDDALERVIARLRGL
jgi:DNA-binding MarR family transcriptional regulator